MWSDVIVIDLHPRYKFLRSNIAVKAPEYLRPLPERSIQPLKDVVVRLCLEVLESQVRVIDKEAWNEEDLKKGEYIEVLIKRIKLK